MTGESLPASPLNCERYEAQNSKSEVHGGGRSAHARPEGVTWSFWREFSNEARLSFSSIFGILRVSAQDFIPAYVILKSLSNKTKN